MKAKSTTKKWNSRKLCPIAKNVTQIENTVANKLEESKLIERMSHMSLLEIKNQFIDILNMKDTKIAKETRNKYMLDVEKINNSTTMYYFLINFQLAADGLGLH